MPELVPPLPASVAAPPSIESLDPPLPPPPVVPCNAGGSALGEHAAENTIKVMNEQNAPEPAGRRVKGIRAS
jgi:hypothetical protein